MRLPSYPRADECACVLSCAVVGLGFPLLAGADLPVIGATHLATLVGGAASKGRALGGTAEGAEGDYGREENDGDDPVPAPVQVRGEVYVVGVPTHR